MLPELSAGAISSILMGANVVNAVIQILGYERLPGAGNYSYCFLISDGETLFCDAFLASPLNHMVNYKELEKFTIVQINEYVCNQIRADKKVIILLNLTVLVPGYEMKGKLGNPVYPSADVITRVITNMPAVSGVTEKGYSNYNAVAACNSSMTMFPQLTTGAINQCLNGETVENAVFQLLCIKKIDGMSDAYRLLMSDGVISYPFLLSMRLSHMVEIKELEKFTILRADKYGCLKNDDEVIFLINFTILVPGNVVNKKIGNPVHLNTRCKLHRMCKCTICK